RALPGVQDVTAERHEGGELDDHVVDVVILRDQDVVQGSSFDISFDADGVIPQVVAPPDPDRQYSSALLTANGAYVDLNGGDRSHLSRLPPGALVAGDVYEDLTSGLYGVSQSYSSSGEVVLPELPAAIATVSFDLVEDGSDPRPAADIVVDGTPTALDLAV